MNIKQTPASEEYQKEVTNGITRLMNMVKKHQDMIDNYVSDSLNTQLEDLPGEIWKDITGFDGKYQISNKGRVKSLQSNKPKILTPTNNGHGYLSIPLQNNNIRKRFYVHRLVAQEFIPNPNNLPQVNHIDENSLNNHVDNLEWCDQLYNNRHGTARQRVDFQRGTAVSCFDKEGNYIRSFYSARNAESILHCSYGDILKCAKGILFSSGGLRWKFYDPVLHKKGYKLPKNEIVPIDSEMRQISVSQFDKDGKYIATYPSVKEASKAIGVLSSHISAILSNKTSCNRAKNFIIKPYKPEYKSGYILPKSEIPDTKYSPYPKHLCIYNLSTNQLIKECKSLHEASEFLHLSRSQISKRIKKHNGIYKQYKLEFVNKD